VLKHLCAALAIVLFGLGWAAPAAAQDVPYVELSAGYNFMRFQPLTFASEGSSATPVNVPKGLYGEVAVNANHAVGFVGLLTNNQIAGDSLFTFMGGIRFSARGFARGPGRSIPFFHVLGGWMRTTTDQSYMDRSLQLGGGANITVSDHAGIRIEADYIRTFYPENVVSGDNYIRFSIGAMYGFGAH
jgi:hypothetical protein